MAYATVQDMIDRLGEQRMTQLTDVAMPTTGAVVGSVAQKALDDASAEIDGYLVGRYALPLASQPELLRVYCQDLAYVRLLGATDDAGALAQRKTVIDYLVRVGKGEIALLPPNQPSAPVGAGTVVFSAGAKTFAREE